MACNITVCCRQHLVHRSSMQAEFQAWYEPLVAEDEEERVAVADTNRVGGGEAKSSPSQLDQSNSNNRPRGVHRHPPNSVGSLDNQHIAAKATSMREGERGASDRIGSDGGGTTPTRRPRPPVDAWGTPPASVSHRRGSSSSAMTGSVSSGGGGGDGGSVAIGGGRGAVHGGAGGSGLLPPLTGKLGNFSPCYSSCSIRILTFESPAPFHCDSEKRRRFEFVSCACLEMCLGRSRGTERLFPPRFPPDA